MRFTLTIDCNSAAFEDNSDELPSMLRLVANALDGAVRGTGKVLDSNGNTVGSWSLTDN